VIKNEQCQYKHKLKSTRPGIC